MAIRKTISRVVRENLLAKITLGVVLPLLLILVIFTIIEYNRHKEAILSNLSSLASQSGIVIENSLRHAMLKSDFSEVQMILDSIGDSQNFSVLYLIDTNGKIIFAPKGNKVGKILDNSQPDCLPCHSLEPEKRPSSILVTTDDGNRVYRSMYPINNAPECSVCHDPNQRLVGLLLTDIPVKSMEAVLASSFRENLFWWIGTIILTVIIVNFMLSRIVLQRLKGFVQAFSDFGQERMDLRLTIGDLDEIGLLAKAFNTMGDRIEAQTTENLKLTENLHRQSDLRAELLKHLITAQEDERKRVSREIHDDLGQSMAALSLQTDILEGLIEKDPDSALEKLSQTQYLIKETTERMYDIILALRPSALDDLGLVAALRSHAERFLDGSGINFELKTEDFHGRLPSDIETALYRIFQEALNNVRRHSGANHVRITLGLIDSIVIGEILDDGKGFNFESVDLQGTDSRGLGLLGIQERVSQYCGEVEFLSKPGSGTLIRVRLPILEANCA